MPGGNPRLKRCNSRNHPRRLLAAPHPWRPPLADLTALILPVLPLSTGVVLPQMVVTIALETDEAKAAIDAVGDDDTVLLLPRIDGQFTRVGAIARIEDRGRCPTAPPRPGRAGRAPGPRAAPAWSAPARPCGSQAEPVDDPPVTERTEQLAREYRAAAGAAARAAGRAAHDGHAPRRRVARRPGRHRRLVARPHPRAQGRAARDHRRRRPPDQGRGLGQGGAGRGRAVRADPHRRERRHGEATSASSCCASSWPPSARSWATRPARRTWPQGYRDQLAERSRHPRRRPHGHRARDRPARAHQPAGGRARLDPHLARHHHRAAVGRALRRPPRPGRGPGRARRRPHRARRGQGPHRRGAGRAQAPPPNGPTTTGPPRTGRRHAATATIRPARRPGRRGPRLDHRPGRPARRGQDLAG